MAFKTGAEVERGGFMTHVYFTLPHCDRMEGGCLEDGGRAGQGKGRTEEGGE